MARKTVYLNEQQEQLYLRTKELAEALGETIASVFVKGMEDYIIENEEKVTEFEPVDLFSGTKDHFLGTTGEVIQFMGKLIGSESVQQDVLYTETLYMTKKGKFVLHKQFDDAQAMSSKTRIQIIETVDELKNIELMPRIADALRKGNITTRFLDI